MSRSVLILVPCYNEAGTITELLAAISRQTVTGLPVYLVDGNSIDGTRQVARDFADKRPELNLSILDNPARIIPAALNIGIAAATTDVVIRLDAHCIPADDYVERCLETLERTGAANVGGVWEIRPRRDHWIARAIAAAGANPLGAGDVRYRIDGEEGPVDTVPFGAFRREWLERVGPFNEQLLTNEDYEYNYRIRQHGGTVWFNPAIRAVYFARGTLKALARQYARYGFWKARMLRRFPRSLRWRQALPPLFVLSTVALGALALLGGLAPFGVPAGGVEASLAEPARTALAVQWASYVLALGLAAAWEALRRGDLLLLFGVPLAIATMHLSWGAAFWWGLIRRADS